MPEVSSSIIIPFKSKKYRVKRPRDARGHSRDGGNGWDDAYRTIEAPESIPTFALAVSPQFANEVEFPIDYAPVLAAGMESHGFLITNNYGRSWQYDQFATGIIEAINVFQ